MSDNTWIASFTTSDDRVSVVVLADRYVDGSTVKHRNHHVEIRVNDESFDRLGLSEAETRELAGLLVQAAGHVRENGGEQ